MNHDQQKDMDTIVAKNLSSCRVDKKGTKLTKQFYNCHSNLSYIHTIQITPNIKQDIVWL